MLHGALGPKRRESDERQLTHTESTNSLPLIVTLSDDMNAIGGDAFTCLDLAG